MQLRLNKREKIMALATAFFLLGIVSFQFIYEPKRRNLLKLQEEMESLDSKISEMMKSLEKSAKLRKEIPELEKALAFWRSKRQGEREVAHFINHLARESKKFGIRLNTMKSEEQNRGSANPAPSSPTYRKIRVDLQFQANYYTLGSYLRGLDGLPYVVTLDHLGIQGKGDRPDNLTVHMRVIIYLFPTPNGASRRGGAV